MKRHQPAKIDSQGPHPDRTDFPTREKDERRQCPHCHCHFFRTRFVKPVRQANGKGEPPKKNEGNHPLRIVLHHKVAAEKSPRTTFQSLRPRSESLSCREAESHCVPHHAESAAILFRRG